MLSNGQFAGLHSSLKSDGGFSAKADTGAAPKEGFMVSVPGREEQVPTDSITPGHIKSYASRNADALGGSDRYLGGWAGDRGVSLDVSRNVTPKEGVSRNMSRSVAHADARTSAMDLGIAYNQEAVWDVERGQELPIKGFTGR